MACNHQNAMHKDSELPCEKSKDAEKATQKCQTYLKNAVCRYEDRRNKLDARQCQLKEKISIMEKTIPALMAVNMINCSENSGSNGVERLRAMMKKLSPLPDPADELVVKLTNSVDKLNRETAELHDKIISTDVQLEETCMELESLELENCELDKQIRLLENKLDAQASLQSITSDDRICLEKIRNLGEAEIRLKRSIRELEKREEALQAQVEHILSPDAMKEKMCGATKGQKHHVYRPRSRRKKCCQNSETSSVSSRSFERDITSDTACNAHKEIPISRASSACESQKRKRKSCQKKRESSETLVHECDCQSRRKSDKQHSSSKICNCEEIPELKNSNSASSTSPWITPEIPYLAELNILLEDCIKSCEEQVI